MNNEYESSINWNVAFPKLKSEFPILNDNDVLFIDGKEDEMISRLEVKIGKTKEEIFNFIQYDIL